MKVTFITTVFNEEKSIEKLLLSLNGQSRFPDEIIIVDAGSTDETIKKIDSFQKNKEIKLKIKVIEHKGNRSVGRNYAINHSLGNIIACSDAGCELDNDWLKNILLPFDDNEIDVVAGYYKPLTNSVFQKCLATYTCVMPDKIDSENFLPSSRSIAFKKDAWKKVGEYNKWLNTCEDLYFAKELKKNGFIFKFKKDAIVYWAQRDNLRQAIAQFFGYAIGDGEARYIRKSTPFLFGRYLLGLLLLIFAILNNSIEIYILIFTLMLLYIYWSIQKNYKYVKDIKALLYLPLLQFTSDFSVILGTSIGLIRSLKIKNKKN